MRPDTCAPTCTVTSADRVPVAVTRATSRPFSTLVVVHFTSAGFWWVFIQAKPPIASSAIATTTIQPTFKRGVGITRRTILCETQRATAFTKFYRPLTPSLGCPPPRDRNHFNNFG